MQHSTPDALVCDFLFINADELGHIIKEDPETIRSWFTQPEPFKGNYFQLDNSPVHNAFNKCDQIKELAEHISTLTAILGSEREVIVFLHRPRKKLGGRSFATIAKSSPNPLPTDNGLNDLIERIQAWFGRKQIDLPCRATAS